MGTIIRNINTLICKFEITIKTKLAYIKKSRSGNDVRHAIATG